MKTVKVASEAHKSMGGFYILNEADFDPKVHKLFAEHTPPPPKAIKDAYTKMKAEDLRALLQASDVGFSEDASDDQLRDLCREHLKT